MIPDESPDVDSVATAVLLDCQAITRPVRMLLLASRAIAVPCVVWPGLIVLDVSETVKVATAAVDAGVVTVNVALPVFEPRVAVIEAVPGARLRTIPAAETMAIEDGLALHVTVPVTMRPRLSRRTAVAVAESPVVTEVGRRDTVTEEMFRYASLFAFVALMSFGAVADLSEQETMLMTARPIAATLESVRFIFVACASSDALQSDRWNFPNNPGARMGAAEREIFETINTIGRRAFRFVRRSRCGA